MPTAYSNPARAFDRYALPDLWIVRFKRGERESEPGDGPSPAGWYWCYCQPGCMPDSDWYGAFRSYGAALADARESAPDGHPLPADGYVYRSSRRDGGRAPSPTCYVVDTRTSLYSYRGMVRIDGRDMHAWRVRPNPSYRIYRARDNEPVPAFRPFYVFSLNIADE